jgi:hypothetical protein
MSINSRRFTIAALNEEDIFKYGKFSSVYQSDWGLPKETGHLGVTVCLSPHINQTDTWISFPLDAKDLPFFFFRKIHKKPIFNNKFVKVEFFIAKYIFYVSTYIFRRKIGFIKGI